MNRLAYQNAIVAIGDLDRRFATNRKVGWVYVLRNPEFKRPMFKIGKTSRPPHIRAAELTKSTGVPEPFQLVYFVHVSDCDGAERAVHEWLAEQRVRWNKEFFSVPLTVAVEALDAAANHFPVFARAGHGPIVLPQAFDEVKLNCSSCGTRNRVKELGIPVNTRCAGCRAELTVPA